MNFKTFGKIPSEDRLKKIEQVDNYREGEFKNVETTSLNPDNISTFKMFRAFYNKPKDVKPDREIPNKKIDLSSIEAEKPTIVWFGHSSYLITHNNFKILVDPVFSGNASPVNIFGKSFSGADNYEVEDLPEIDLLILTHDHYDHLDFPTIEKLHSKTKKIITSLGVASHLEYWGVFPNKITELNWWEYITINKNLKITATPARHFSGRGFTRAKTLWSSFVLELDRYKIFIGADSGYDDQFKRIGAYFKGFDIAFLECGQYSEHWPQIHMFPEETVKAAKDLDTKIVFPVHWGKFMLSTHPWNQSIKRFIKEAAVQEQEYIAPIIGETYVLGENYMQTNWWDF
ncbi:MBL fold metallo-hydrolase [Gillisia sp. Hel_I_29]|uniref:MBL fold metallo-hydrolase n=1 Tax=Gillisia sp. Hel_I_29 TaxID=1249975 RepID=UPI000551122A|nr:MBL fold metallo-hydrolase [Gillisia sp. Hel_I_29]